MWAVVQAEAGTRVEVYEAQIAKMALALERADSDKARLEHERALLQSELASFRDSAAGRPHSGAVGRSATPGKARGVQVSMVLM